MNSTRLNTLKPFIFSISLQKMKAKSFVVTRYLREEDVQDVHYVYKKGHSKVQTIESFHAELLALRFIQIHSPIISQRTRPTSSELNGLLLKTLQSKNLMEIASVNQSHFEVRIHERDALQKFMSLHYERGDEAKDLLITLRSLELLILDQSIKHLKAKYPDGDTDIRSKCQEFVMYSRVDELDTIQRKRFDTYRSSLQKAHDTPMHLHSISTLHGILPAFSKTWNTYINDMKLAFDDWENGLLNNKMVSMKASIEYYFEESGDSHIQIDHATQDCRKSIDATERRLDALQENDLVKTTEELMLQCQKHIKADLRQVDQLVPILKKLAQRALNEANER